MTQAHLIARLKAIEMALDDARGNINPERGFAEVIEEQIEDALSDLRELIKEAEGQKPAAYGDRLGTHLQSVWPIPSTGVPLWMSYKKPLYTALGEKP